MTGLCVPAVALLCANPAGDSAGTDVDGRGCVMYQAYTRTDPGSAEGA
jgi:hypothetical protein